MSSKNITGRNIARTREQKGLTIEQVAFGLPADFVMGPKELHEKEAGQKRIYDIELLAIANFLGVSVDSLFGTPQHRKKHKK